MKKKTPIADTLVIMASVFFMSWICYMLYYEFTYKEKLKKAPKYTVKLIYCDDRKPKTIYFRSFFYPEKHDIDTYYEAMPRYRGEVNVCDIQVISVKK